MIYLDHEDLLYIAERAIGRPPEVHEKAAALLHSLARNHPLIDGNKRLALAATIAFYGLNGHRLTFTNDQAYELVIDVADGTLGDVPAIAHALRDGVVSAD